MKTQPVLTNTKIDLADCHTTLYHFEPANRSPMSLGSERNYRKLYQRLAERPPTDYRDITGKNGSVLGRLAPSYSRDKYWFRYLSSSKYEDFYERAWEFLVPIQVSLVRRLDYVQDARFGFRVVPLPRVLLYPFGWSAWVSLRVLGEHTIPQLVDLLRRVFAERSFLFGNTTKMSLSEFFAELSSCVREDAFGDHDTKDIDSQDVLTVTTVMAKHDGIPAPGGLTQEEEAQMLKLVRPSTSRPRSKGGLKKNVLNLPGCKDLSYMIYDTYGRFLWLEHLLNPVGRNYQHLDCYHNNTFRSLVQARHLYSLVNEASRPKSRRTKNEPLEELLQFAVELLEGPCQNNGYYNASLLQFLKESFVAGSVKKARALLHL